MGGFSSFSSFGGGGGFPGAFDSDDDSSSPFGGQPFGQRKHKRPSGTSSSFPSGSRFNEIPPGTHIMVKNLMKRSDLNGDMGVIVEFDPSSDRYVVQLEDESLKLKRENIQQIVEQVEVVGLQNKPELNGSLGTCFDRNLSSDRYQVRLAKGGTISLSPSNVIFPVGTSVVIVGLAKAAQFNGRVATIVEVLRNDGRYTVQVGGEEKVRVKYENVRI